MKTFYHDHPLRETPPGALSCDELRFWIRWLLKTPGTPWGPMQLGRAFGCAGQQPDAAVLTKLSGGWIYPSQQLRWSKQLPRVLSGELVPVRIGQRREVRVAEKPQPLRLPARWRYDLKRGKLEHHPFRMPRYRDPLPAFKAVMGTEAWNGRWND